MNRLFHTVLIDGWGKVPMKGLQAEQGQGALAREQAEIK